MYISASSVASSNDMTGDEFHNNNADPTKISKKFISMCFGCGNQINDQFILRVAPDLEWHAKCLKCAECGQFLDESCTCFVRNGKTYCKLDYVSKKCFKCKEGFSKNDLVMRANNRIYHVDCFRCCMCSKQLAPGDEYALKEDGLLCKFDNELFDKQMSPPFNSNNNQNTITTINNNNNTSLQLPHHTLLTSITNNLTNTISTTTNNTSTNTTATTNPSSQQSLLTSTSCQNITNLQPSNNNLSNPSSKCLIKCEDLNAPNDYEDNQNCLSPSLSQNSMTNLSGHHLPHHHLGHLTHLGHPHHSLSQNAHLMSNQSPNGSGSVGGVVMGANPRLATSTSSPSLTNPNGVLNTNQNSSNSSCGSTGSSASSNGSSGGNNGLIHHGHHRKDKTTRVRTVLNEKQLHTLRTCYGANPRPDALMKEQLVEMTGLSPRVIRVWFQNKRCKDKKKTILIKQMQEQQKNRQSIGHGISMIASSPVRNDISNLGAPSQVEIQQTANAYHQSNAMAWKSMSDYGGMNGMGGVGGGGMNNGDLMGGMNASAAYDQMMGFGSDEEDCYDQMSDQGGDDSVSSVGGLDDSRIQQL